MSVSATLLGVGTASAVFMAWGIGANDVANEFATSIGSKVLTLRKALVLAAVFESCGAILAGSHVSDTIRKGIVDVDLYVNEPYLLAIGMICALVGGGVWLLIASYFKLPVSTTHSIIGGTIGFSLVAKGVEGINGITVLLIVISWVASPLLSGIISWVFYTVIDKLVLQKEDAIKRGLRVIPWVFGVVMTINSFLIVYKGSPGLGLADTPLWVGLVVSFGIGFVMSMIGILVVQLYVKKRLGEEENPEKLFNFAQVLTACFGAFAHGANDTANAVGPYAAVVSIAMTGMVSQRTEIPVWVTLVGVGGIVIGLATWGYRVIETVGKRLTEITPSKGVAMELGASFTVVVASRLGIPVSTTHCQIGSVLAIGMKYRQVDWGLTRNILISWLVTLPVAGGVSAMVYAIVQKVIFG